MEVTGKIIVALPEVGGTSQKGNAWKKREYVLETQETYPRKVFFNFFGDRVDQYPLQVGQLVKISFDIDSREYNGRWYVEVRAPQPAAYGAPAAYGPAQNMPQGYAAPSAAPVPPMPDLTPSATDDLPF